MEIKQVELAARNVTDTSFDGEAVVAQLVPGNEASALIIALYEDDMAQKSRRPQRSLRKGDGMPGHKAANDRGGASRDSGDDPLAAVPVG